MFSAYKPWSRRWPRDDIYSSDFRDLRVPMDDEIGGELHVRAFVPESPGEPSPVVGVLGGWSSWGKKMAYVGDHMAQRGYPSLVLLEYRQNGRDIAEKFLDERWEDTRTGRLRAAIAKLAMRRIVRSDESSYRQDAVGLLDVADDVFSDMGVRTVDEAALTGLSLGGYAAAITDDSRVRARAAMAPHRHNGQRPREGVLYVVPENDDVAPKEENAYPMVESTPGEARRLEFPGEHDSLEDHIGRHSGTTRRVKRGRVLEVDHSVKPAAAKEIGDWLDYRFGRIPQESLNGHKGPWTLVENHGF